MDALLTHVLVVACDDGRRILEDTAVAVRGSTIVAVGSTDALERDHPDLPRIPCRGLAAFPGFVNAHTHTVLIVLRGTIEDWDGNVVYGYMSPVSYVMEPAERAVLAQLGCIEAIRSGATTLVDPFRFNRDYAPAMAATGLRLWLSESCADIDTNKIRAGDYSEDRAFGERFLERATASIEALHGSFGGRVRCQVAAHATDNCSPWMLARLRELAARHGVSRTVHLAQGPDEVRAVKAARGLTPAAYLDREGFLGPDLVGAHWTYCTDADVELLAERGVFMAHCPANSSRRGPHPAPLGRIRRAGVRIAIGTDNMTEDMFQAMKIGLITRRGGGRDDDFGTEPPPGELLDGITRIAAASVGALAEIGSLEPGKKADITLIDLDTAVMRPLINPVSNLVHYGHPGIVHSVMADGAWLMRDRRLVTVDEQEVLREAQRVTQRVWTRMLERHPDIPPPPGGLRWLSA